MVEEQAVSKVLFFPSSCLFGLLFHPQDTQSGGVRSFETLITCNRLHSHFPEDSPLLISTLFEAHDLPN
jgi:hypothetical protein